MKTISKKIKTIYLLAMMAILSVCIAVFPVFKTETVKAETEPEVSLTGAYIQISKANGADDFALKFEAKINQEWYEETAKDQKISFGMAIGPAGSMGDLSVDNMATKIADGSIVAKYDLIGTISSNATQKIVIDSSEEDLTYEAGTYFDRFNYSGDAAALATWQNYYAMELIAVPFMTVDVDGTITTTLFEKSEPTSAKEVAFNTMMVETNKPADSFQNETYAKEVQRAISDEAFEQITGYNINAQQYAGKDIYFEKYTYQMFAEFNTGLKDASHAYTRLYPWSPIASGNEYNSAAYASGYIAGQPLKAAVKNAANHNVVAFSTDHVDNPAAFNDLIGGANYRFYYFNEANGTLDYFEYKVADGVLGGGRSAAYGSKMLSTSYFSYFYYTIAVASNVASISMPTTYADRGYENYDGYYVLGGDQVFDPLHKSLSLEKGGTLHADQASGRMSIGSLKNSNRYHQLDTTDINKYGAAFTGTFDGRGCTIDGSFGRGGIFGVVNGGTIKNLNVVANLYDYTGSNPVSISTTSYGEKNAVLAEFMYNANIENVSIKLEENAPKNFNDVYHDGAVGTESKLPEMNKIPALISSLGIAGENTKLTNVIVECDTLKDTGVSFQNYRAAFNISSEVKAENINNVFAIGSSYSYMTIDAKNGRYAIPEPGTPYAEIADAYVLTISVNEAPSGLEFGVEYQLNQNQDLINEYGAMIFDICKTMKKFNIIEEGKIKDNIYIKFVEEKVMKFATNDDFQAWLDGDGAETKEALLATGLWFETDGTVAWDFVEPGVFANKDTAQKANTGATLFLTAYGNTLKEVGADTAATYYNWFEGTFETLFQPAE